MFQLAPSGVLGISGTNYDVKLYLICFPVWGLLPRSRLALLKRMTLLATEGANVNSSPALWRLSRCLKRAPILQIIRPTNRLVVRCMLIASFKLIRRSRGCPILLAGSCLLFRLHRRRCHVWCAGWPSWH